MKDPLQGLNSKQAKELHQRLGPNEIITSDFQSRWSELKSILLDPMGIMLLGLSGLYALLGDQADAIILAIAYLPVITVDVFLNLRASRALKALSGTLHSKARVIRDGVMQEIPTREVVVGDLVVMEEGDALPADGTVLESAALFVDESALTGESVPIEKAVKDPFSAGTWVSQGRGIGSVERIASQTRFGKIADLVAHTGQNQSPLQRKVRSVIGKVLILALGLSGFLFILEMGRGRGWIPSVIAALTFGMAAVPEEFPLVFTLYLSLGAWRLSRFGVLVKALPSVETLGSVEVICTDKTGTLTEGKFQLEELRVLDQGDQLEQKGPTDGHRLDALMSCETHPVDLMDAAIYEKFRSTVAELEAYELWRDYPFEANGKHMSHVWRRLNSDQKRICMKGAVEGVLEHCQLDEALRKKVEEEVRRLAATGKRILALAAREGALTGVRLEDERDLKLIGLLVFSDPIRSSTSHAIQACERAGIVIKMLTGDHPLTAHALADQAGMKHSHDFLFTGDQLASMTVESRREAFLKGAVFSRVLPEQKHELVRVLKESGKVVAMTGDGINDAPALRLADIGISMGASATDAARAAAKMILLKNDFQGIVEAVFEGRRIFSNLTRSFSYLVSFHVPVVLLALLPPALGWGDLLLPIHVVLLELIVHPLSAFAFENLSLAKGLKSRELLPKRRLMEALVSGLLLSFVCLYSFQHFSSQGEMDLGRSLALVSILFGNLGFVIVESWPEFGRRFVLIGIAMIFLTGVLLMVPTVSQVFHLVAVPSKMAILAGGMGFASSVPGLLMRIRSS